MYLQAGVETSWVSDDNWTKILSEKYLEENGAKIPIADGTIDWDMLNDMNMERLHHEIYLSDARKVAPEKWKTVIRHPIKKL